MKRKIVHSTLIQYYLPLAFTLFMFITMKRTVTTDGGYTELEGFPFPYISNNFGCSFCYDVYIGALLIDLAIYIGFVWLLFRLLERTGMKIITHWFIFWIGMLITLFWVYIFYLFTGDSSFKLVNDVAYKTTKKEIVVGFH
jgi:hypothetical protein